MANNSEDIKWLYDKLKAKGYNIGSQQEFTSSLANDADRDWYYSKAVGMGLNVGSKDDFNALYAPAKTSAAASARSGQSAQPQASSSRPAKSQPTAQQTQSTPQPTQPTWQPTEQDKIRMSDQLSTMLYDFNQRSKARIEQTRRMTERYTPEGRKKLNAKKFQAQLAGTPTQVMGITPPAPVSDAQGVEADGAEQKPIQSDQSPVPYGVKYVDGKPVTEWLLPDGRLTTSLVEADQAEYGARTARLRHQFENRMKENGLDPSKQEDVQKQEQLDYEAPIRKAVAAAIEADDERSRQEQEAYMSNPLNMVGGVNAALGHAAARKKAGIGDLNLIAEKAYESLPSGYRRELVASYTDYFTKHPEATNGKTIDQAAQDAAKSVVYGQVHETYVGRNAPKSATEFFVRKMLELNPSSVALSSIINPYGQAYAELDAMERYGAEHRGLDIAGTVAGMVIDPTTYFSAGVGNLAFKRATRLAGKAMAKKAVGDVAGRYATTALAGRLIGGIAAGGANFGTFEAVKDAERQLYQGGYLNPKTGEMEGFSFGSVLYSGVHGVGMGAATGIVSPLIGNVADKVVKASTSTAGKVAMRGGEQLLSTVAEGTIFSIPEWINGEQDAFDVWTDNMAMMAGFKLSHAVKTAPAMIRSLRPVKPTGNRPLTRDERIHNNKSFAERVRERMDASPSDIALTADEREELRSKGYGELSDLFAFDPDHKSRKAPQAQTVEGDYVGVKGLSRDVDHEPRLEENGNPEFDGYEAMERLMEDSSVSEATRAKAYYILTGRQLPMSTITGWTMDNDEDGNITVSSLSHQGGVVTSRRFKSKEEAQREIDRINRQAELNTIDIGEQDRNAEAQQRVMEAAIHEISPGADPRTVYNIYEAVRRGDKNVTEDQRTMADMIDEAIERNSMAGDEVSPAGIRRRVAEETGVDVDKAIRKEPGKRTEAEKGAVKTYLERLFPEEARQRAEEPTPEQAEAQGKYEEGRSLYDRFEEGDPTVQADADAIAIRMQEAYQGVEDAFGPESEYYMFHLNENPWDLVNDPELTVEQQDAVLYYINAKAALDGVMDASNEAAADKRQKVQEEVEHRTHKELGMIVPAIMKLDDRPTYIIKGDVAMFPDGSGVDVRNSSDAIIILDEQGEYRFVSPDQILSVGETIDPRTELQTAYEAIDREQEAIIGAATEGVPEMSGNDPNSAETSASASEQSEYDRGYEEGIEAANQWDDRTLNDVIGYLRELDFLTDDWRGQLDAYEYIQQERANITNPGVPKTEESVPNPTGNAVSEGENVSETDASVENGQETALSRIPTNEQGEPMFEAVDKETAWDGLVEAVGGESDAADIAAAQVQQATADLEALKKKPPTPKAPKLKGSAMAMAQAKREAAEKYQTELEAYNQQVADTQARLDAWNGIVGVYASRNAEVRRQREEERRQRDAAIADRKQRAEAEARQRGGGAASEQTENAGRRSGESEDRAGGDAGRDGQRADNLEQKQEVTAPLSEEKDEYGHNFVLSSDKTTSFGHIDEESGLAPLPIKLSVGENHKGEDGKNHGYGLLHIEAGHKDQILNAGFSSVEEFVESVARNYTDIREGAIVAGNQTYLLEVSDSHNNTLFIQLSNDGKYWNINSAGIFKKKYSRNKAEVYNRPALGNGKDTDTIGVNSGQSKGATAPAGNSPKTSDGKDNALPADKQANGRESSLGERISEAESKVNLSPTEAQKEAGNYKKGHVQVGAFDITIENPKGSKRSGVDADGKPWETTMAHTYGYIRGTEAPDGDHIDVFLSSDIDAWEGRKVFVVDQYNPDGSFDEHKVMLGFNDRDEAFAAYLSNYEKGWEKGRRLDVTEANLEDFEKWIDSSHRKMKAFVEYKSVKPSDVKPKFDRTVPATPEAQRSAIAKIVDFAKRIKDRVERAVIGRITKRQAKDFAEQGIEVDNTWVHSFESSAVSHNQKHHGSEKTEASRGQIAITHEDYFRIPEILENYDKVLKSPNKTKGTENDVIIYEKEFGDGYVYYLEEKRDNRKSLSFHTMYKKKKGTDSSDGFAVDTTAPITPIAPPDNLSSNSGDKDNALSSDKQTSRGESSKGYAITPAVYKGKKKETPMHRVTFDRELTGEQERAVKAFANERTGEGRFAPKRGWFDREANDGSWLFRTEEDARKAGEMIGNEEAVADAQPLTAEELREAVDRDSAKTSASASAQSGESSSASSSAQSGESSSASASAQSGTSSSKKAGRKGIKAGKDSSGKPSPINRVSLEDVAKDLQTKGEAKLSDHAEPLTHDGSDTIDWDDPADLSHNPFGPEPKEEQHEISDDEMQSLANELRDLLGIGEDEGDSTLKFRDPGELTPQERQRIQSAGIRLAMGLVERGTTSFPDYATKMVGLLGDKIRPWLKSFYEGARWTPGYENYAFTPSEEVARFDVQNFDKRLADPIAQAAMIVEEHKASAVGKKAQEELTEIRNKKRKENEKQTAADTAALAEKAEAVASEAESLAETSEDTGALNRAGEEIDQTLDEVNDQLALLGYYEAEADDAKFHESYGYMLTAEKKAVADATKLAKQLVNDLGLDIKVTSATTPLGRKGVKKGTAVRANLAPAGGDVTIALPLQDGRELHIYIGLDPVHSRGGNAYKNGYGYGDNLEVRSIMYRVEAPGVKGVDRYGNNQWIQPDCTYSDFLRSIKNITRDFLPKQEERKAEQAFPDAKDTEAVSKWLEENSEAIWKGVDSITKDAVADVNIRNTFKASNDDSIKEADLADFIDRWMADRLVNMMAKHPATVKAWYDYGQRGLIGSVIAGRIEDALAKENNAHKNEAVNGFKVGEKVWYTRNDGKGKRELATIVDFGGGSDVTLDTGMAPVMYETCEWSQIAKQDTSAPADSSGRRSATAEKPTDAPKKEDIFEEAARVAKEAQEKKKKSAPKKKSEVKPEQPIGDLFGGLFDEPISDEKKTDVQPRPGTAERAGGHEPQPNEPLGASQRNEVKRTDRGGMGGRNSGHPVTDGKGGARVSEQPASRAELEPLPEAERKNVRNNHAERGVDYAPKGEDARIKANIEAIELAKRLLDAGETATPEQMAVLRKFSGWGGLGKAFNDSGYNPTVKRLRELLGEQGYQDAVDSRRSAYYTPANVIDAMWDVVRALGFKGGNILEGSAGIGNILGLMPSDMSERSNIHAVEIDSTTGGILSLLYPDAKVEIQGFEDTKVRNNSVDLAITNVPFITDAKVFDKTGDKDLSKKFRHIYDFCIAKNIRKLREGGIGIFISSSGTMDNSKELRRWIINEGNADVIGAFRMHNKTFGGTGATSDIIVVRKRVNGKPSANAIDVTDVTAVRVADYDTGDTRKVKGQEVPIIKPYSMIYNKYFAEHPENMAGEMMFNFERGETRFPTSRALFPSADKPQEKMLSEWAGRFADMEEDMSSLRSGHDVEEAVTRINEKLGDGVKEGSMVLNSEGQLCFARMGEAVPIMSPQADKGKPQRTDEQRLSMFQDKKVKGHTKAECFKAYSAIKKALSDVLEYQSANEDDAGLEPLLKELNRAFDTFTRTYGNLHKNTAISFLRNDVDFSSIMALETYSEKGDKKGNKVVKVGKTDIFSRRVIEKEKEPQPTTVKDGILASLYKSGGIDVDYISEALGKSKEQVKQEIVESGLGFENPSTGAMEVSYQYLSGNVREKLHIAQENNEGGRYDANISALEKVMPMTIPAHLIEFSLGSSWIEPKLYEDFVEEKTGIRVKLTNAGGTWFMKTPWSTYNEKNRAMSVTSKMCGKTIMGHELIEAAITNKQITVSKTTKKWDGTSETITDKAATAECSTKIDEIRAEFKDWARERMQADPDMSARIEHTYNEQFNNYVPMSIPDEFVPQHFGGQVTELHGRPFALRPHQGRAVVRGTTEPILLAHEVGTGKTYTLITTAMEMRRLGTARKPMIVVQNATVGQFVESAKEIYPNAKVLTIEEADRTAEGRKNFYAKIKYNDWDMIVVPQSVFERIPDSEERELAYIQDVIEEKLRVLDAMREADDSGRSMIVRQAEKEIEEQRDRLAELTEAIQGKKKKRDEKREATTRQNAEVRAMEMLDREVDDVENFDDMGIDALLIDEAHEYKHLGFSTAMQRGVKGVDPSYSKKSQGVYLKTQAVMERNHGRNVVFATGTPISNTAAEIWTFMRYLMPADTMKEYGIYYFDDFVRNFGNLAQMVEFKTNGKFAEVSRFAGYVNLPELVRIWSGVADTVLTREAGGVSDKIPDMEGGKPTDIYLPQTRALRSVMKYVKAELDRYDKMEGKEKKENSHIPLTMYGIAKAAAVDARLVVDNAEDDPNSKTNATVRETLRSLKESGKYKGTVAIFSDNYQNKRSGFNLYEEIRNKLIAEGVPAEQIVIIKSGMTIKKKLDIFDKVNAGEIRVVLGSTFTLGTGVNIQERLHTLIHVDAPNRPMDYTQRNGRALRQGNLHKDMGIPVRIIRFGVEDSLDVTAYQRLKTKGAIADSIMNGSKMMQNSMENRVLEEEEDSFGDMTAQLSGSEYAILKNQAEREVRNLTASQKGHDIDQIYIHNQLPKVEGLIKGAERRIEIETKNLEIIGKHWPDGAIKKIAIGKLTFDSVGAMGDFFKEQNAKMNEAADQIQEGADNWTSKLTIDVDGLPFEVTTNVSRIVDNNGQGQISFEPKREVTYSCEALGIKDRSVKGNRLKNIMEEIAERIVTGTDSQELLSRGQQQLARYSDDYHQLKERNGKEFPFKKQLVEAKERLAQYEEAMRKELEEKEKKYAEMDKAVDAASDISLDNDEDTPTNGDGNKYRLVEEGPVLDFLNNQPLKKGFRYSQWANMGVLPPMTAKQNGEWRAPMIFSRWEQSEEGMMNANGKADLVQGNGRTTGGVAYNPYFHIRTSPLNDQFTAAYDRPELLVVEGYYPESEETSGYHAEGAKDSVGLMDWHSGSVNGQLSEETKVQTMLSRYFKPSRIVPWSEVADLIMERVGDQKVTFPINAVPPMLRAELAKRGAKFSGISGSVAEADVAMLEDLRERVNGGEWDAGLERAREYMDAYESSPEAKEARVESLSKDLHTPIRVIRDQSEIDTLPTRRERRAKGWWSSEDDGVVVVLPNNVNVADVDNTVVHEVVGHKGLRALIGEERFDEFLGVIYDHASKLIRKVIDKMTDDMVGAEADRLRVRKSMAHERAGEDVNSHYYTDMAEARVEAEKKREQYRKEATEEYMSDLGGRIGSEGFEKMSREELTLWGKIKAKVQQFLDKFLQGLKIAKSIRLNDKDLSYILYKSWKNMRETRMGHKDVFMEAEDVVRRQGTRFSEVRESERLDVRKEAVANRIEELFDEAIEGKLSGKPVEVGKLTEGGRDFLERLSGHPMKEIVSFVVNPSDLVHINRRHFGKNEKDGRNIPLTKEDIRNMHKILCEPDKVIYGKEKTAQGRDMFFFLKEAENGSYNLMEVYADRKGNLTSKSFFKSKEGVSQRAMLLNESSTLTSVTDGATLLDGVKLQKFFEYPKFEGEDDVIRFRDPDMGLEETITKMKLDAMQAHSGNLQAKREAMRAIGGNLSKLRQAMARQREYDIQTAKSVKDLARVLMDAGLLDNLGNAEVKSLLSQMNNAIGRQDISKQTERVIEVMINNHLRNTEAAFGKLISVRSNRVDARGIQVQGELDPDGQAILKTFNSWKGLPVSEIDNRIADAVDGMSDPFAPLAERSALEYAGLQIARDYAENISKSKADEKLLREEIKKAREEKDAGRMTADACRQFEEATKVSIQQLRMDRIGAYEGLMERLGGELGESVIRAKAWRDSEKQRVNHIHHLANSDMEGRELRGDRADTRMQKFANSVVVRFFLEPLSTLDQMLKMFGGKNPNGEGYMQNYFMRKWIDAADKEQTMKERYHKQMDAKAAEIFGTHKVWYNGYTKSQPYSYTDLYDYADSLPKVAVTYFDGAEMREYEIGQGELLYLYAVDKMAMGRATNRRMCIDDATMQNITDALDPKLKEYADWVQEEMLPAMGIEMDEVHMRMFGAHMDNIENYFPFVRDKNALKREVENGQESQPNDRISVQTGAIKKRVPSVSKWDIRNCHFFDVLAKHVDQDGCHWSAFAELNRDLGALLSYNRLKQRVFGMSSVYGAGEQLWKRFAQCAAIATDAYEPKRAKFDELMVQGAKGVTMGKISFRLFTALKQTLSLPAFFGEVSPRYMAADLMTGGVQACKWAWQNMPNYRKRILSRTAGDYRLRANEYDGKIMKASSYGMLPNIGVDAWTIAVGSHGIFKTKKAKYLRWGMSEADAERRAVQDAELAFNKSQQSSEGPFMAPVQVDHTMYATSAMLFRNSSTSYTREAHASARNLSNILSGDVNEEYVAKQILRTLYPDREEAWTDDEWESARKQAKKEIRSAVVKNTVNLAMFGWILPWLWRIGGIAPLLLLSSDDEEKQKQKEDALKQSYFAPIEGIAYGNVVSDVLSMAAGNNDKSIYNVGRSNPFFSDILSALKKADKDKVAAANDVINIIGGMAIGVNPQTITDWTVAIMDYCGEDANTSRECALLVARLLSCPQSQLDKIYFDELGASGEEASRMAPAEIAERYARYKVRRSGPLTGWAYSEEEREAAMEKHREKSNTKAKEVLAKQINTASGPNINEWMEEYKATAKRRTQIGKLRNEDEDEYYRQLNELEESPEFARYEVIHDYKRDIDDLTKQWLNAKTAAEADSLARAMVRVREIMLSDIEGYKSNK